MKAKAYIAYKHNDDNYSVYESLNGGEEYWLYDLLQTYITDEDKRVTDLFGASVGKIEGSAKKENYVEIGDRDIIERNPIARNIAKREVNRIIPNIGAEIVFVVDENSVIESFIPVNTSPTIIDGLVNETTIELFDGDVTKYDVLEGNVDPVMRVNSNEDVMDVIGTGGVKEGFLEQYHRCFADLYVDMKHKSKMEKWVAVGGFTARIIVNDVLSDYEMVNIGIPIQVTWENNTPSYGMYADGMNAYGGLPKVFGSQLRLKIHPEYQKVVKSIQQNEMTEETVARSIQPIADKIIQQMYKNFTDEILFEYTTEAFEENVKMVI